MINRDIFIDANFLIYYQNKNSILYTKSKDILKQVSAQNMVGVISPYVLNEIHYFYLKNDTPENASLACEYILATKSIKFVDFTMKISDFKLVLDISSKYRLKTFDAFHAYYCEKLKIKHIATFDSDFKRVPWIKVFDAL